MPMKQHVKKLKSKSHAGKTQYEWFDFVFIGRGQQCGFEVSLLVSVDLSGLEHLPSTGRGMFPTGVV